MSSPDKHLPQVIGVLGGGRMGAGIAHAFCSIGCRVVVVERDRDSAQEARQRVLADIATSIERGKLGGQVADFDANLHVDTDHTAFADCDLLIEAVFEDWDVKVAALRSMETHAKQGAWLASNTSSLSIDGLAEQLEHPERFCGLHFFNPVPSSKLVEVVLGAHTSEELATLAGVWVEALGKTAVVVHDAPGFASSRLGVAIALEAIRMVEEGVAEPRDIDNAMVLGYKFPVGPLELTDIVGLDVRLGIAQYLHSKLGDRFAPPQLLHDMVARGELGRKSGRGFYVYDGEDQR